MVAAERTTQVTLDGRLDEPAWAASTPAIGFRQQEPNEGQPATQPTEMRILYDDVALYIGARMYDSLGARGVRAYLTRRDQQNDGDYLAEARAVRADATRGRTSRPGSQLPERGR
jgi:hypothetical protein